MRPKPPILGYIVTERIFNRRITLRRDEVDGGYHLLLENCLTKEDAAERLADKVNPIELRRGRILVTRLFLSNEAMGSIFHLYQHHEQQAVKRKKHRNQRQQTIIARLAALEEAALDEELGPKELLPAPPVPPAPKSPRKPRKPSE